MKSILPSVLCTVLLAAVLSSCEKLDEKLDINKLEGTWSEQYDPAVFAMDGSVSYTFDRNGHYQLHVYDALAGMSHEQNGCYVLDPVHNTLQLEPEKADRVYTHTTYTLVKLTSKEMAWQKSGTEYAVGTWGSDYRHFVRVE